MAKIDTLKRQIIIIELLRKHPANFEQINDHLERKTIEEGYSFTQRVII